MLQDYQPPINNLTIKQIFGNQQPLQSIQQQDIITSIQFDPTGTLLAIGDNAGRIIIFKEQFQTQNQSKSFKSFKKIQQQTKIKKTFEYHSEFQSHSLQFDTLKSMRMSETIKSIKWLKQQGKYNKMITSNGHRIKLFKLYQKQQKKLILTGQRRNNHLKIQNQDELAIPLLQSQPIFTSQPQLIFPIKHQTQINNVQITKNQQYIFSTDQKTSFLWSIQRPDSPFILSDISNSNKTWKQSQIISCSKLHNIKDNIFLLGSSKGNIQLNDIRQSFHHRNNIVFNYQEQSINHNFTEMTKKINSLQFIHDKYIISRDYLTIKVWDILQNSQPLKIIHTNQSLQYRLSDLFEQQCLQDQFDISLYQNSIITGSYDNRFNIINPITAQNIEYKMNFNKNLCKKSTIYPKNTNSNNLNQQSLFKPNFNINRKIQKTSIHESSNKIALASLNSFFIYQKENYTHNQ